MFPAFDIVACIQTHLSLPLAGCCMGSTYMIQLLGEVNLILWSFLLLPPAAKQFDRRLIGLKLYMDMIYVEDGACMRLPGNQGG